MGRCWFFCFSIFLFFSSLLPVFSATPIEISGAGKKQIGIAVVPFDGDASVTGELLGLVRDDLVGSGFFHVDLLPPQGRVSSLACADLSSWKRPGVDVVLRGHLVFEGKNNNTVFFSVCDVNRGLERARAGFRFSGAQVRRVAHIVADQIFKSLLGIDGYFSSQLAYVLKKEGAFELCVSDVDGRNRKVLVKSAWPLLSPRWSPDGFYLAFVSLEQHKPIVYLIDAMSGQRRLLANYKGSNSSPAWSPHGDQLSLVLTKDGYSDIYLIDPKGRHLTPLIHSLAIDTEPVFSSDGASLFFTSDRGGTPQIYRYFFQTNRIERITFDGSYNVSAAVSPDGSLAYVTQQPGKGFAVAVRDGVRQEVRILTSGPNDESPSFSPNGQLIAYAANDEKNGILSIVSLDGQVRYSLIFPEAQVISPSWSFEIHQ